jgi:hypothetical protein
MLTELLHKGGCLCQPAREGKLRCPLIVRPTSEDVVTGHVFQSLKAFNPRWWLPDILNEALGVGCFQRQVYRNLKIHLWQNKPMYPRELLPWAEGSTQVDSIITWENPPTTVYIEMKYRSELSPVTSRNQGQHGFPADQLSRNARVGLLECGYFTCDQLFPTKRRDFLLLLISPEKGNPLVCQYRDPEQLRSAIPHSELIPQLPRLPFIGELSYHDLVRILRKQLRWFGRSEKVLANMLIEYLEMKLVTWPRKMLSDSESLLFEQVHEN